MCDFPASVFVPELLELYPDAKVILCERDVDRWFESIEKAIIANVYDPFTRVVSWVDPGFIGKMAGTFDRIYDCWMDCRSAEDMRELLLLSFLSIGGEVPSG